MPWTTRHTWGMPIVVPKTETRNTRRHRNPQQRAGPTQMKRILARTHMMNEMMTAAARMAQDRAGHGDVLDYATRLGASHTFADEKVRSMARDLRVDLDAMTGQMQRMMQGAGPRRTRTRTPLTTLRSKLERLQSSRGRSFDHEFVQTIGKAHQVAVQSRSMARARPDTGALEETLSRLIPILEQHAALARSLQQDATEIEG